jgi:carboxyl-terminal processing protease
VVVDLRGNRGGLAAMIVGVAGHFLDTRDTLGTFQMRRSSLRIVANPRRVSGAGARVSPFAGPVAVLVDEGSASASEVFAGGMRALGRVRVFGAASAGAVLPAVWDRLPNGDILYHAIAEFVTAADERLEGRGVLPDEPVALTRRDLLAGRDPVLDAALAWIDRQ